MKEQQTKDNKRILQVITPDTKPKPKHRNYTIENGKRVHWYCTNRHTHSLYPALGYRCQEKGCTCFHCGRSNK